MTRRSLWCLILLTAAAVSLAGFGPSTQLPTPAKAAEPATKPSEAMKVTAQAPTTPPSVPTPTDAPSVAFPAKGKAVSMIVPYPAGGGSDNGARVLAAQLGRSC